MKEYFLDLLNYNQWANNKLMGILLENEAPVNTLSYMSHLMVAEIVWLSRILNEDYGSYKLWESIEIGRLRKIQIEFDKKWIEMIKENENFDKMVSYQNTKGESYSSKLSEIITHVANHGTYHRGQMAIDLRENGIQAVSTDYIFYKRENQ